MVLPVTSRRLRGLALAGCAAVALPLLAATPAGAQTTTTSTATSGATSASALRLTINLPGALPITPIQLDIDPVAGTVRAVTGSAPEAQAVAAIISGRVGDQAQSFGLAEAMLPEPTEASGSPLAQLNEGIAASPLADFLAVSLAESEASVTPAPNSASRAGTTLGVGLPLPLAEALAQVLEPVLAGIATIIAEVEAGFEDPNQQLCEGLEPITEPLAGGVGSIPGLGTVLEDVVNGLTDADAGVLCSLASYLSDLNEELSASLLDLAGPGGVFSTGLITAEQSITTEGTKTTARSTAEVAGLSILGQNPFGTARVLSTTSTAVVDNGLAEATVEADAVDAFARPLLELETDLEEITGIALDSITLDGLTEVLATVQGVLEALAGIGIEGGRLGDPENTTLEACPEELTPTLSGTYEEAGVCAAAAARGYGLALTLPAELAEPLGVTGPLLQLTFAPSAAVARMETTTTTTPAPPVATGTLPRTGAEVPLAAAGVALLMGAALVRRRRLAVADA
jgi:hypothetical protein